MATAQPEKRKGIKWDEETIAEHDKERGTRQKIDEAPTPFHHNSDSDHSDSEEKQRRSSFSEERSSGTVIDNNWSSIQAKLIYHQQQGSGEEEQHPLKPLPTGPSLAQPPVSVFSAAAAAATAAVSSANSNYSVNGRTSPGYSSSGSVGSGTQSPHSILRRSRFAQESLGETLTKNDGSSHVQSSQPQLPQHSPHSQHHVKLREPALVDERAIDADDEEDGEEEDDGGADSDFYVVTPGLDGDDHRPRKYDGDHQEGDKFKGMRAAHYNEFKVLQAMRQRREELGDDDDEEDDEA